MEYPTVDYDFVCSLIQSAAKVKHTVTVGDTFVYITEGDKAIVERIFLLRRTPDNCVDYFLASGIAIKLKKLRELLEWLESNRGWKEGGYNTGP